MVKTIAISMAKGGVGKTSTAVNLSAALAISGKKVLIIDLDPQQGSSTLALGFSPGEIKFTIANIISSLLDLGQVDRLEKNVLHVSNNLDLLPANPKLETVQNRLIAERSSAGMFTDENAIPSHEVIKHILFDIQEAYDYIIIDCPPSVSMLTINALVAADSVILPMEAHYECFEALRQIFDVIARIKANWNPKLAVEGVLITKYQSRTRLCREVSEYTNQNFGDKVLIFKDTIPLSIKAAELTSLGVSIFDHAPDSEVAAAYDNLAKAVLANA